MPVRTTDDVVAGLVVRRRSRNALRCGAPLPPRVARRTCVCHGHNYLPIFRKGKHLARLVGPREHGRHKPTTAASSFARLGSSESVLLPAARRLGRLYCKQTDVHTLSPPRRHILTLHGPTCPQTTIPSSIQQLPQLPVPISRACTLHAAERPPRPLTMRKMRLAFPPPSGTHPIYCIA